MTKKEISQYIESLSPANKREFLYQLVRASSKEKQFDKDSIFYDIPKEVVLDFLIQCSDKADFFFRSTTGDVLRPSKDLSLNEENDRLIIMSSANEFLKKMFDLDEEDLEEELEFEDEEDEEDEEDDIIDKILDSGEQLKDVKIIVLAYLNEEAVILQSPAFFIPFVMQKRSLNTGESFVLVPGTNINITFPYRKKQDNTKQALLSDSLNVEVSEIVHISESELSSITYYVLRAGRRQNGPVKVIIDDEPCRIVIVNESDINIFDLFKYSSN